MLEHPLQLLVRVIRHLHEETNEIVFKIFVGVRETWKFDFDSWYYWEDVYSCMKLPQLLGFPEKKLQNPFLYTLDEDNTGNCPIDDRDELYPPEMVPPKPETSEELKAPQRRLSSEA